VLIVLKHLQNKMKIILSTISQEPQTTTINALHQSVVLKLEHLENPWSVC
jgi:hypothetical protein